MLIQKKTKKSKNSKKQIKNKKNKKALKSKEWSKKKLFSCEKKFFNVNNHFTSERS